MITDRREGWLGDLKVDDHVIIVDHPHGGKYIAVVERITPSGQIVTVRPGKVLSEHRFSAQGRSGDGWYGSRLVEYTPQLHNEISEANVRARSINTIRNADLAKVDTVRLASVARTIREALEAK